MAKPRSARCLVCETALDGGLRVLLVQGRGQEEHCSETCLLVTVRDRRAARATRNRRLLLRALAVVLVVGAGRFVWHRYRLPPSLAITFDAANLEVIEPPPPLPNAYGPAWPPTDEDWKYAFGRAAWIHPLPGPVRRAPLASDLMLGPESPTHRPAVCRQEPRCGVQLGGALWGEHVLAALDGVVDRVQRNVGGGGGPHAAGQYIRIAHFGGMVYTQYFHLAGMPRHIFRGARVKAGEVIALLGDTGLGEPTPGSTSVSNTADGPRRHLHFALSVRPTVNFTEVYWDPTPWMERWPLRTPSRGTVAGFMPADHQGDLPRRYPR